MKIGAYGSAAGSIGDDVKQKARAIGREVASRGHTLVTGACHGLPQDAVIGAGEIGGKVIGYSPGIDMKDHVERFKFPIEGFTELVYIPADWMHVDDPRACKKYRNVSSVAAVDAGIIMGGRIGTMNEFTLLYDMERDIGVLEGSGGITEEAIDVLLKAANKESKSRIVRDADPTALVLKLTGLD
ncbi:MAG: hypothetical protein HYS81_00955 [Candidatus Aenigmatarchaeota archaeon]|nr:MAG: hypothetical protein HYS81_00955 [Candidatus Aenigmarchaeota archaeon]